MVGGCHERGEAAGLLHEALSGTVSSPTLSLCPPLMKRHVLAVIVKAITVCSGTMISDHIVQFRLNIAIHIFYGIEKTELELPSILNAPHSRYLSIPHPSKLLLQ